MPIKVTLTIEYEFPDELEGLVFSHPLRDLERTDQVIDQVDRVLHAVAETGALQA